MNNYFDEEEYTESKFDLEIWIKIFKMMTPFKKHLIVGVAAAIMLAAVDAVYPQINRYAILMAGDKDLSKLPLFIGLYIVLMIVIGSMVYTFIIHAGKLQQKLSYTLRKKAFHNLQKLPFSYYDKTPVGWIMARMTSDSRNLSEILSWGMIDMSWGSLMMIFITIAMLLTDWQLALIVLAVMPILLLVSYYFRKKILHAYRKIRKENSKITGAFNEGITGAKTTKTLVLEEQNYRDFDRKTSTMKRHSIRAAMFAGLYFPTILFIASVATGVVMYYGGNRIALDIIEVATLATFIMYIGQFFDPVMQLANILARFQQAQASAERLMSLIETEPDIWDRPDVIDTYGDAIDFKRENWEPLHGKVEFRDVTFKYDKGEKVLDHFNLTINEGESIALVGHTGAGKSTIVNLVCRFYEPTDGTILIDGRDYKDRSLGWLHANLGYVLQSPHLFSGTIKDNIQYGNEEATMEDIIEAAKLVEAHDFIIEFEDGYDTVVGEGGARLSVGQKQLISFARALIANPRILILDEATSSVDTKTEKSIQRAIEVVLRNRTSIVVAHRLSTITTSDRILVLEDGNIIESGTHQELIKETGKYYQLYTNQFKNEQVEKSRISS
ncbi:ABC transporter ATP-binding protein [Candidatus Xianfuyuplasma coldseepsis]|uniref:ABC transporter ATP-binding protein n=1 Tax=Candidatus Xianfuyuplasma coldseepsis TaxID=2782163 RepID=A0A7L7KW28_9MOLU|nr:ABC transporter ATP-binding protein [Xianfuyuplasma coldseepsis]QMS85958.1 ABC transporter ATP-binding protein [Xianfuyuplasma coldseepsis]